MERLAAQGSKDACDRAAKPGGADHAPHKRAGQREDRLTVPSCRGAIRGTQWGKPLHRSNEGQKNGAEIKKYHRLQGMLLHAKTPRLLIHMYFAWYL